MNKQEAADKKELLEKKTEGEEAGQEILEFDAQKAKEELKGFYEQNIGELTPEEQSALEAGDIENISQLHRTAKELSRITEEKIEQEIKEKTIEHLPNYLADSEEAKKVDIITASSRIQKRFEEKISPSMKEAVAAVCSNVFNKNKYPYALFGSNCYIPHTEYSEKIPDDLDIIFGIKDLGIDLKDISEEQGPDGKTATKVLKYGDGAYAELVKMQEQGLVKNLSVEEQRRFGKEKNGCIKVHCFIKTSGGWKEMEAFAQNMYDEVANEGKKKNGIINLGVDQERLEVVDINGVKVNIGGEKLAEELYLKNIVNEFGLYNLNGWEKKGSINAKALQRIFNVINLDSQRFENSIDQLIEKIGAIESPTEEAQAAQMSLAELWNKFKSLQKKGPGLVNYLMEENDLKINAADDRERRILTTEKAVDIITAETREDMKNMSGRYASLEKNCREILDASEFSPEKSRWAIAAIDEEVSNLSTVGIKYKRYLHKVNSADKNDFCVYAAMPRLRNQFIRPLITRLMKNRRDLENKLTK